MDGYKKVLTYVILIILAVIWLIPAYSMAVDGFKSNFDVLITPVLMPPLHPTLSAYGAVIGTLEGAILNSAIVSLVVAVVAVFFGSMGAFYFYTLTLSYSKTLTLVADAIFALISLATFIPYQSVLMPLTKFIVDIGGLDNYYGLIVAFLIFYLPMAALLMSIFISSIPKHIVEAAKIDGASSFRIFMYIILPIMIPALLSTFIFVFVEIWNNFFIPLILSTTPSMRLVPVAVRLYSGGYGVLYNESYAASVIASIVPLAIFVFLGRYFIRGLLALGGSKGV
ncbi:glucose ABC transporter permease GlcU [Tardisphaera saccharovorans]